MPLLVWIGVLRLLVLRIARWLELERPPKKDVSRIMLGRHALVIGATTYAGNELINAADDARRMAATLRMRGFNAEVYIDPTLSEIDNACNLFKSLAQSSDMALVYLAGHAVERYGAGYFLPVDFSFSPTAGGLRCTAVGLNAFVEAMDGAKSRIMVVDACRNWPSDSDEARRVANDLEELRADERSWPNLLLAYATSATKGAGDGLAGEGSAFSNSLSRHLLDHSLTVDECFRRVSQDVVAKRRDQQPWTYSSLAQTLSFTDLPRYAAIQRYAVPNPEYLGSGTWSACDARRQAIIVGVGDARAWNVELSGCNRLNHGAEDRLMGAADCGGHVFLAGSEGALYVAGGGGQPVLDLKVRHTFGLKASPASDSFIHYGAGIVGSIEIKAGLNEVARHDVGFSVYCCAYLPNGLVWVAGEGGRICEIDPRDSSTPVREISRVCHHVNSITVAPGGDRIFLVGQHGLAVELDGSGRQIAELLPNRTFKTAAGIRDKLISITDDTHIRRFIFEPSRLSKRMFDDLATHLGVPDFPTCALAPTLPILAIATQESSVILIDTRDHQIIQEIDVGSGNSAYVSGVHFLTDYELVVIGGRGDVTFFLG